MCGMVIFLDSRRSSLDMTLALGAMKHRGFPTTNGWTQRGCYTLGHTRLPVRGLDSAYNQPFLIGNDASVFVGEVFNSHGQNDALYSIEKLYDFGPSVAAGFDGFFSIAYTQGPEILRVITDHLSIKPLYYSPEEQVIASELDVIRSVCDLEPDPVYFSNVLKWGYSPDNRTPYLGVERLDPGSVYTFREGRLSDKYRYFDLFPNPDADLREVIERAVENRMISDIPIASLCSGGLDSTIVTMLAAELNPNMTVFHVENEENEFAEMVPLPSGVIRKWIPLESVNLEDAIAANQTPVDLGSVVPQYALAKAVAKEEFHVCLTGDGADELFGGYRRAKEFDSQRSDMFIELPAYHLPRLDAILMSHTIELRSPFLAPDVIRAALAIPYKQRTNKQALKQAFRGYVPDKIIGRPKLALRTQDVVSGGTGYRKQLIEIFQGVINVN